MNHLSLYFQKCCDHGTAPSETFIEQLARVGLGVDGPDVAGSSIVLTNLDGEDLRIILETLRVIDHSKITGIDASGCHLTVEDARRLVYCIADNRALSLLNLSAPAASITLLEEFAATCRQAFPGESI